MADGMAKWQKEWQNGRMAGMATYVLFMVHADTNNDDDDDDDTLIFYSIEKGKKIFFGLWVSLADMQKSIQPGKLTYVGNWYYYFGQRKLLKPSTMALWEKIVPRGHL
jgi:hypothetical protein